MNQPALPASNSRRKPVLVTGGAGFLGSHLVDALLARGDAVLCLDNLSTGTMRNLDHLAGHPRFTFVKGDVTRPLQVEVDRIYNLACPASPRQYRADPVGTTRTCVLGALNMLDLARQAGCPILQASTSEVYGDPEVHPQPEAYRGHVNPVGQRACYNEGKRCAETLFADYQREFGVRVRIARIFNTYGPRMAPGDGRVVSNFISQALAGDPITVYGDGTQTRSFCHVDDMIDGLIRLMETEADLPGPVNLGNPEEVTIATLADRVAALSGCDGGIVHHPLPQDDPTRRCPDIARARAVLGWAPRVSLEDGLRRTIAVARAAGPAAVTGAGG